MASTPVVCVGSRQYFEKHWVPSEPAELARHNCLVYGGFEEAANWPFVGQQGHFKVAVRGNLTSNSVETIRPGVLAGVGIALFTKASLVGELSHADVVTILDDYAQATRDISFVWPKRRLVAARVRRVTDFFATSLEGPGLSFNNLSSELMLARNLSILFSDICPETQCPDPRGH